MSDLKFLPDVDGAEDRFDCEIGNMQFATFKSSMGGWIGTVAINTDCDVGYVYEATKEDIIARLQKMVDILDETGYFHLMKLQCTLAGTIIKCKYGYAALVVPEVYDELMLTNMSKAVIDIDNKEICDAEPDS